MSKQSYKPTTKLTGVWLSEYGYRDNVLQKSGISKHFVYIYPTLRGVVVESIPEYNDSYLQARFSIDEGIATGTWTETTSLTGDYKGATYRGSALLVISPDRTHMVGKWLAYGRKRVIKSGPWRLKYLGEDESVLDKS